MVGVIRVLLLNVSVVDLPISVSVDVGRVKTPVLLIVEMVGVIRVLLLNVSTLDRDTNVSDVSGNNITLFEVTPLVLIVQVPVEPFPIDNPSILFIAI